LFLIVLIGVLGGKIGWGIIIAIIIFKKIPRYYIFFGTKFSKAIKNKM